MKIEQITSAELLDQYARILGENWQQFVEYGLGPVLLGGGILVGARSDSGDCVGIVWANYTKDTTTLYFGNIQVAEQYRRLKVATQLELELCRLAVANGATWGFTLAECRNEESDLFIRSRGWVVLGVVSNCYWIGDASVFYFKDLIASNRTPPVESPFWSVVYSLISENEVSRNGRS